MRHQRLAVMALTAMLASPAAATVRTPPSRSGADVLRAERQWSAAEEHGNVAFVYGLLVPDYVSVAADGSVHDKAAIIAQTRRNRTPDANAAARVAAWRAAHPTRRQLRLLGDTAIVSFISTAPADAGRVNSSDVFVFRFGGWHAVYSQHSAVGNS